MGIDDWWEIGGERKRGAAVFSPLESGREPIQWCVYAARNCWASICEINEFHNVLTTFTVKTKSRLRGWIGGGKDVTRAENGAGWSGRSKRGRGREGRGGVEATAVLIPPPALAARERGLGRVTFSHLRVLVTMILLDEAAATIVKPFPWVVLEIFESFRHDLNHRPPPVCTRSL